MQPLALEDFLSRDDILKDRIITGQNPIDFIMTTFDAMQSVSLVLLLVDQIDGRCPAGLRHC